MTVIDPNSLATNPKHKLILLSMLRNAEEDRFGWGEWRPYKVQHDNEQVKVKLTHTVIKRLSKKGGFRYDIIDSAALGKGSYGAVYPVTMTYKIVDNELISKEKPLGKRRVVKVIEHRDDKIIVEKALAEYEVTYRTPHLSPKEPVVYDNWIFSVSKRLEGQELLQIVNDDFSRRRILTIEERFQLTLNLIEAFQTQVLDVGLVHRDIKPENIIVNLESRSVGAIDYGFAKVGEERAEKETVGSAIYAAPEVFLDLGTNRLSDVYSLGRVIGLIWHNDLKLYQANNPEAHLQRAIENDYSNLFKNIDGMHPEAMKAIRKTLEKMTAFDNKDRCELKEAYTRFCFAKEFQFAPPIVKERKKEPVAEASLQINSQKKEKKKEKKKKVSFAEPQETKKWGRFFSFKKKSKGDSSLSASSKKKEKEEFQKHPDDRNPVDTP